MKKEGLLLLLLLAGIPGCGGKKYDTVCCDAPTEEQVEENEYVMDSDLDDDEESVRSFFNEETGEFEADLEEWVFADNLDFPMMAENNETESMPETVEVAVADIDADFTDEKKKTTFEQQSLEETFKTVFFDEGCADLREDQKDVIEHNIAHAKVIMNEYDGAGNLHPCTLVIEGHADNATEAADVSQMRARVLADKFIEAGIPEEFICVEDRGADVPMIVEGKPVDADSMEQWANRRSEVHMICA